MKELAKATDRRLSELYKDIAYLQHRLDSEADMVRHSAGQRKDYRSGEWNGSWDDACGSNGIDVPKWFTNWKFTQFKLNDAYIEVRELNKVFMEHRWSRFFLVAAHNGHIHSSMDCHSCYSTTEYIWLPDLSGETEADAVAAEGEILCTFCFPSAPSAWTEGIGRRTKEEQDAKAAEKAAKMAAKAEKSLSLDGSVVSISAPANDGVNRWGNHKDFKTYKAAELWLVDAMVAKQVWLEPNCWTHHGPDAMTDQNMELVLSMMATKKGVSMDSIVEGLTKRVNKKAQAEVAWRVR